MEAPDVLKACLSPTKEVTGNKKLHHDAPWGHVDNEIAADYRLVDNTSEFVQEAHKEIRSLKSFRNVVGALYTMLDTKISDTEERFKKTIFGYGVQTLPSEVLEDILDLSASSATELWGLSKVCKRFRQIVVSSQPLWARREFDNTQDEPGLFMAVISNTEFCHNVIVKDILPATWSKSVSFLSRDMRKYLDIISRHSLRWEGISFQVIWSDDLKFVSNYPQGDFASLQRLSVVHADVPPFFENWSMPNLQCLETGSWIPPTGFAPNLIEFRVSMSWLVGNVAEELISFLCPLRYLRRFGLSLWRQHPSRTNPDFYIGWTPKAACSSSSSLSFDLHVDHATDLASLNVLSKSLSVLKVDYLRLHLDNIVGWDNGAWEDALKQFVNSFQHLESLDLQILNRNNLTSSVGDVVPFLKVVPQTLCSFSMDVVDYCDIPIGIGVSLGAEHRLPHFLRLRFINCENLTDDNLLRFSHVLKSFNSTPERVEITQCPQVTGKALRQIFHGSDVVWEMPH